MEDQQNQQITSPEQEQENEPFLSADLSTTESTLTTINKWSDKLGALKIFISNNYKALIGSVVVVAVILTGIFYFKEDGALLPSRQYSQAYILVNEKLSKSAPIVINLPNGVTKAEAQPGITFEPEIKGNWIDTESATQLIFKPSKELGIGKYYAVNLETPTTQLRKDFLVDEDPQIQAIFPSEGSEANENSSITVVFNRPMVPLTTLDELDKEDIPVELSPSTEGKFKWISTRNLQFIPSERLQRSTNYKLVINNGLMSADGLPVKGMTHEFTTRPLRYVNLRDGQTLYNQPISLVFNQPVDLDRTIKEITVTDSSLNKNVSFVTEHGISQIYNREKREYEEFIDRSILNIYQKKDRHGRDGLWDFKTSYRLEIKKAYPLEGDITLSQSRSTSIQVPDIIESLSATSERSKYVRPDLFDPQGELLVTFYEDIDKGRAQIEAKGLQNIEYGEVCKKDDDGYVIRLGTGECDKEEDRKVLILSFKPNSFGRGENVPVEFEKIYNPEGFKINADPIIKTITTYPTFKVSKTIPTEGSKAASLTEFIACSNTPIKPMGKEDYTDSLIADGYLVFSRWQNPVYVERASSYYKCSIGEFQTTIRYGLLPETDYSLTTKFEDDFEQKTEKTLSFRSTTPDQRFVRFHNLQKVYNVTQPGKTKFTYAVENLESVNLHICKVGPETLLEKITNQSKRTDPPQTSICQSVKTDTIELPKRYWVNNYFQINLADYFTDTLGHYIVTFSSPDYRESHGSRLHLYDRTYTSVTRLAVGEKRVKWDTGYYSKYQKDREGRDLSGNLTEPGENLYWVSHLNTLEPIIGAAVSIYKQDNDKAPVRFVTTAVTNGEGIARSEVIRDVAGVVVNYFGDSTIVSDWADILQRTQLAQDGGKTYIYTDRPIYRPGQEVFIKGIDRVGYDGTYEVFRERKAKLKITDSRNSVVYEQNLPISEYGTFDVSFKIPNDAPLGSYRIDVFGNEARFDVEEYVPAAFRLDITSEEDEYVAGEVMNLDVGAQYFFGVPVEGGEVSYSVTSQDYFFDKYTDEYFNFGRGWYSCYSCGYGDNFLFRGKTELDQNGKAKIEEAIDFSKFYKDPNDEGSKIFVVNVTVKDSNGRSVSSQKSFIVHRGEIYLGVKADKHFMSKNTEFTLRAKSVDIDGNPKGVGDITLEINKVKWEVFKRREVDGGFYSRSEKRIELVKKDSISTDRKGDWDDTFSLKNEGQYEISLSTKDSLGNQISVSTNIYVYGEGQVDIRPTNNYTLEIETERLDVDVGDRPEIIIKSPYNRAKALITVDRGKVFDYWIVDVDRNLFDHTIPIKKEYGPNAYVSVLLLSDEPEIKFGQVMFNINRDQHELNVDVRPNKNHYLPGEIATLNVKTTNYLGKPVSAEVSLAVTDLSVLALKGNPKKNPLIFFYDGFPLTVTTASNIKNILYELDIPLGTKGGGGSAEPEDLARRQRGIFKDTAFWEAKVETNANGIATISFTLPDNLTTWQIESLGITQDTLVGVDYDEVIARKDLMVIPLKPRFVVPGDEFYIGAKIFNQTNNRQRLDVSIQSDTLELVEDSNANVSIDEETSDTIYFKAKAPEALQSGVHTFVLSAKSSLYEDTVLNSISITRNETYEAVATANFTKANSANEYIYIPESALLDKGGLTINANATMAVFLGDALNYLVSYPYGCSEQLASKLSSIGTVQRGLNLENVGDKFTLDDVWFEGGNYSVEEVVELGLGRIYEAQTSDGGFSYYKGMSTNFYLTLHIVQALENLREAGFDINSDSLNRASQYLYIRITTDAQLNENKDLVILTAFTLDDIDSFSKLNKETLKRRIGNIAGDIEFLNENISSVSLAYLAVLTEEGYSRSIKEHVFEALENRIDVDGRGAYLKGNKSNTVWQFYETPVKNTALLLKALVAHENEHPLLDKITRWLLRSRNKDGAWGSTNNTLTTIDAMVDYLEWQRETESDFVLTGNLDNEEVFEFDFNKDTILETFTKFIPIDGFTVNKTSILGFNRENRNELQNNFYYDMALKYYLPIDEIAPRDEGITLSRSLYELTDEGNTTPLTEAKIGDVLRGKLTITIPKAYNFVAVEDFIPAGFELVNFGLTTEDQSLRDGGARGSVDTIKYAGLNALPQKRSSLVKRAWLSVKEAFGESNDQLAQVGGALPTTYLDEAEKPRILFRPDFEETHDDRLFLFKEHINPGVYEYEYYVRALVPGIFHHLPAVASEMYFPEIFGRTEGNYFTVTLD